MRDRLVAFEVEGSVQRKNRFGWRNHGMTLAYIAVVVVHLGILLQGILIHFPNTDEVAHLPAGISHWQYENFDLYRVNPPLVRLLAGLPAWLMGQDCHCVPVPDSVGQRPEFQSGTMILYETKLDLHKGYVVPRILCLVFDLLLVWRLTTWLALIMGGASGLVTLVLVCFCPNILAHAQTIVPDVGATAFGVLAAFAFWRYVHNPNTMCAILAGAALGGALLTKLTWVTAIISLPVTVLLCRMVLQKSLPSRSKLAQTLDLATIWVVALVVLNAGYLFEGSGIQLKHYKFCSHALGGQEASEGQLGNRFQGSLLGELPVPVPRNYVLGIDYLRYEVEHRKWSFLAGEWKLGSWPQYYLVAILLKTPESTLLAAGLGLFYFAVMAMKRRVAPDVLTAMALLVLPAIVCFLSVSLQGGFNHHHRYILIVYPSIFAMAAFLACTKVIEPMAALSAKPSATRMGQLSFASVRQPLALIAACMSALITLPVHPHYTSYFNLSAGGPSNGWKWLAFSNVEWGQDLLMLADWIEKHPDHRPLLFAFDYYGCNGELFDLPKMWPQPMPLGRSVELVRSSETQWVVVTVNLLFNHPETAGFQYLQELQPEARIGFAYHVYRIEGTGVRQQEDIADNNILDDELPGSRDVHARR